jgi:hypothetical protein
MKMKMKKDDFDDVDEVQLFGTESQPEIAEFNLNSEKINELIYITIQSSFIDPNNEKRIMRN